MAFSLPAPGIKIPALQIAEVLADLNDLNITDPIPALDLASANKRKLLRPQCSSIPRDFILPETPLGRLTGTTAPSRKDSSVTLLGREDSGQSFGSAGTETPPRVTLSESDVDMERAKTLMTLHEMKGRISQQENAGLSRARAHVADIEGKYRLRKSNAEARMSTL